MPPRLAATACLLLLLSTPTAPARDDYKSLDDLRDSYAKQLLDLDRRRVADLSALAARLKGDEAEASYRELFEIAVARDLYAEAEAAAEHYRKTSGADPREKALATLVAIIAKANRGEYDRSLADLAAAFQAAPAADDPSRRVDPGTAIALGEAYLQRLLRGNRPDVARKACEMILARRADPEVRDHFTARLARIAMIGRPAPPIVGRDVDGKPATLAELRGKVVLVDFWATWCPPCVAAFPRMNALQARYGTDGFVILGVNLDARREGAGEVSRVTPAVRQFLLNSRASWPNVLIGASRPEDPASTYAVEEIPANFLIGRDGTVLRVETAGPDLEKAVAEAIKGAK